MDFVASELFKDKQAAAQLDFIIGSWFSKGIRSLTSLSSQVALYWS